MQLSDFGERMTCESGILELMDDLGSALAGGEHKYMLGGGNPAQIPEINAVWRKRMTEIADDPQEMVRMLANYDTSQGHERFLDALAGLLRQEFGWPVTSANIAVTNGSQNAFFLLFNMLSGRFRDGSRRKILFPLMPEYIGYADQCLDREAFVSQRSRIETIDTHTFKYHIDFERLRVGPDIGAICISRPTNPSGNVLTDAEVARLAELARRSEVPLLIDNAYGTPFPQIVFEEARPIWDRNTILGMSLSKLGLPSVRTGIVIAREEVVRAVSAANAVASLASGTVGQVLLLPLIESGEILRLSHEVIRPYYLRKSAMAIDWVRESMGPHVDYAVHKAEGALFLWLWFKDLPITTKELYDRLKRRNVIVVPGRYFFFGLDAPWDHADQCIRITYSQADDDVRTGIEIIADEVRRL